MTSDNTLKPIVHVATDEKFIDAAYEIYEKAFPGKNRFVILLNDGEKNIKYLSTDKEYLYLDTGKDFVSRFNFQYKNASVFVFHGLNYAQSLVALSLGNQKKTLIWSVFGSEVYHNPYIFGKELYGKKTYSQFIFSIKNKVKSFLRPFYYYLIKGIQAPYKSRLLALRKMAKVGILFNEEFQLYKEKIHLDKNIDHLKFTYYALDVIVDKSHVVTGDNILVGNSASYTNNHLEVFDILKHLEIKKRRIICPLSYGKPKYATRIAEKGSKIFGSKFEALTDFLPLKDYQKVLQDCGIVIMNHYRQQAVGNVMNTMYLGSKVFLSVNNTLYHYLKRIGCYVYCIEDDLVPENSGVFNLLTENQVKYNREILEKELSLERVCSALQQNLNSLLD